MKNETSFKIAITFAVATNLFLLLVAGAGLIHIYKMKKSAKVIAIQEERQKDEASEKRIKELEKKVELQHQEMRRLRQFIWDHVQ